MNRVRRCRAAGTVALVALIVLAAATAWAQLPIPITVAGELLWTSGDKMLIAVDGRSVPIDLTAIPLDGYLALRPGAAVLVRGVWSEGGLLVADSLGALPGVASPAEREGL